MSSFLNEARKDFNYGRFRGGLDRKLGKYGPWTPQIPHGAGAKKAGYVVGRYPGRLAVGAGVLAGAAGAYAAHRSRKKREMSATDPITYLSAKLDEVVEFGSKKNVKNRG